MAKKDIIVIGGSAGSHSALKQILEHLPADLPASIFIATHVPMNSSGYLAKSLEPTSRMPLSSAVDGQAIERNHVYVAVPDHHLLVIDGTMRLGNGPVENMTRPAIDPLFRSAALSYGPRVVGVILSGLFNDGASGLSAIKACGGTAIVQHPLDANEDQMPLAALETVDADKIAPVADLARVIAETIEEDAGDPISQPESLQLEVEMAGGPAIGPSELLQIADGAENVDEALSIALRLMEERVALVTRIAADARRMGRTTVAELYESRAEEYGRHARVLREAAVAALRDRNTTAEAG